jgi:hypothetical protein
MHHLDYHYASQRLFKQSYETNTLTMPSAETISAVAHQKPRLAHKTDWKAHAIQYRKHLFAYLK